MVGWCLCLDIPLRICAVLFVLPARVGSIFLVVLWVCLASIRWCDPRFTMGEIHEMHLLKILLSNIGIASGLLDCFQILLVQ
jgi:hypothetical protein